MSIDLIRARTAQWLIEQLGTMGIQPSRLLEGTTCDGVWLTQETASITYPHYARIITNALEATADGAIGLKVGRTVNLALFGAFGYALMSSRTLKDAADVFLKYQDLPGQLTRISMQRRGPEWVIRFDPLYPFKDRLLVYAIEEVLSTTYYGMVFLVNRDVDLIAIDLSYPAPGHAGLYADMFRCPVRFGAPQNRMRVEACFFDLPVRTANQNVYEYCTRFCDEMLGALTQSDPFIDRIRGLILASPGRFLKTGEMAEELGMSTRSLNRRLEEHDTSYKKIVNEVRADLATRYLEDTNLSIDQIADLIGFAETTTFRKTFKLWTGRSAAQHRKEVQARAQHASTVSKA